MTKALNEIYDSHLPFVPLRKRKADFRMANEAKSAQMWKEKEVQEEKNESFTHNTQNI